jgi:hypothetical protein
MSDDLQPLQRIKRTGNEGHWEWVINNRRTLFEDTVNSILEYFTREQGGDYTLDESFALHGDGWRAFTTICIFDYWKASRQDHDKKTPRQKPKNAEYLRTILIEYLEWGLKIFEVTQDGEPRSPKQQVIPAMPDFEKFLASRKKTRSA